MLKLSSIFNFIIDKRIIEKTPVFLHVDKSLTKIASIYYKTIRVFPSQILKQVEGVPKKEKKMGVSLGPEHI